MACSKLGEEVDGPDGFGRQPVKWFGSGIDGRVCHQGVRKSDFIGAKFRTFFCVKVPNFFESSFELFSTQL
jgi:hypothetical protein